MSQLRSAPASDPAVIPRISRRGGRGTAVAQGSWVSRAVLVVASSCCLMGCLITRDPSFEPPENLPPSVHGSAETPMYEIRRVCRNCAGGGLADAGPVQNVVRFVATVRDANVRDELQGRVYLNLDRDSDFPTRNLVDEVEVPPDLDNDPYSREVEFAFTPSRLDVDCNVVELHVSREFAGALSLAPAEPGDIGIGVWYIGAYEEGGEEPDLSGCLTELAP